MVQFYLLSVVFNIIAALILIYGKSFSDSTLISAGESDDVSENDNSESAESSGFFGNMTGLDNGIFRLVIGILCSFIGIIKFISAYKGIPVIGDFLPAIAGLFAGASILIEYFYINSTEEEPLPESVRMVFLDYRKYIGIGCFVVALLHFVMPGIIVF